MKELLVISTIILALILYSIAPQTALVAASWLGIAVVIGALIDIVRGIIRFSKNRGEW